MKTRNNLLLYLQAYGLCIASQWHSHKFLSSFKIISRSFLLYKETRFTRCFPYGGSFYQGSSSQHHYTTRLRCRKNLYGRSTGMLKFVGGKSHSTRKGEDH